MVLTLSAIVSCDGNCIDNGGDDNPGLNNFSADIRLDIHQKKKNNNNNN